MLLIPQGLGNSEAVKANLPHETNNAGFHESAIFQSSEDKKSQGYTWPKILRKFQIDILPCTVERIKKKHCLLSSCSSFRLTNLLLFHLDMETTFSLINPLFQMYPRLLTPCDCMRQMMSCTPTAEVLTGM